MEDIIGGCCFGYRNTNSPHSIQARALVCWVSRLFLPGLPLTSADASLHLPQSADYIFHCRVPRRRMRSPVPLLSFLRFLNLSSFVLFCTVSKRRQLKTAAERKHFALEKSGRGNL